MACLKLGSKRDGFQRKGQAWFCASGIPSDVVIEVEEMSFHLHKFPLISRSGTLAKLMEDAFEEDEEEIYHILIPHIPGGPDAFELAVKFCYGVRLELTAANLVPLRCAAEYLNMSEEFGEGNLIARTEDFLNQVVLKHWKECIHALHCCEPILPNAEKLGITKRCVDSLATMACTSIAGNAPPDRWYEGISVLGPPMFTRLIIAMEARGMNNEHIALMLIQYARTYLPILSRRQKGIEEARSLALPLDRQKNVLETVEKLLPTQKSAVPTGILSGLLRTAMILNASDSCKSSLERRVGMQLEKASLEDLLIPNLSPCLETLYDIDCAQRILNHFLLSDQSSRSISFSGSDDKGHLISYTTVTPMVTVARLADTYLDEVASDVHLKLVRFRQLTEALPDYSRASHDELYRAIDVYLKAHPWLSEEEREELCQIMDCQKLSLEACSHATVNERLPLRVVLQVLFSEQSQLKMAFARCSTVSCTDLSRQQVRGGERRGSAVRERQVLRVNMDKMRVRVSELEEECDHIRHEMEMLENPRVGKFKPWLCSNVDSTRTTRRTSFKTTQA